MTWIIVVRGKRDVLFILLALLVNSSQEVREWELRSTRYAIKLATFARPTLDSGLRLRLFLGKLGYYLTPQVLRDPAESNYIKKSIHSHKKKPLNELTLLH